MILQRLAFIQNSVKYRQQFNGAIRSNITASYDDIQCRPMSSLGRPVCRPAGNCHVWMSSTRPKISEYYRTNPVEPFPEQPSSHKWFKSR